MKQYIYLSLLLITACPLFAQNHDYNWMFGYECYGGAGFGGTDLYFYNNSLNIIPFPFDINLDNTNASISDKNGNLLFYTNGFAVLNVQGDTVCSGLNPEGFSSQWLLHGNRVIQGALFLPIPNDSTQYYLLHCAIANDSIYYYSPNIYATILEVTFTYPFGHTVSKNQPLISGDLETGCITATKHANGRDWWILIKERATMDYHRLLLTPLGMKNIGIQHIGQGITNPVSGVQSCFSPNGRKYAKYECQKIHLYDFDRCMGELSNYDSALLNCSGAGGISFSPSSRFIYVTTGTKIYQYDTEAPNLANSQILVADYDGFTSPFATTFFLMQNAPDGKIYISTANGTDYLHVIDYPDSLGLACHVQQHSVHLFGYNALGIPNFPNYRLGALAGSACDTLWSTAAQPPQEKVNVQVYPNPAEKELSISLQNVQDKTTFVLYDALGKQVLQQSILQGAEIAKINVAHLPKGMYFYLLKSEKGILAQGKIIKE